MYIIILFKYQLFKPMMKHFWGSDKKSGRKIVFRIECKTMAAILGGKKEIKQKRDIANTYILWNYKMPF